MNKSKFTVCIVYEPSRSTLANLNKLNRTLEKLNTSKFEVLVLYQQVPNLAELTARFTNLRFWRMPLVNPPQAWQIIHYAARQSRTERLVFIGSGILLQRNDLYYLSQAVAREGALFSLLDVHRLFVSRAGNGLLNLVRQSLLFCWWRAHFFLDEYLFQPLPAHTALVGFDLVKLRSLWRIITYHEKKMILKNALKLMREGGELLQLDYFCQKYQLSWFNTGRARSALLPEYSDRFNLSSMKERLYLSYKLLFTLIKNMLQRKTTMITLKAELFFIMVSHLALLLAIINIPFISWLSFWLLSAALLCQLPALFYRLPWRKPLRLIFEFSLRLLWLPFI